MALFGSEVEKNIKLAAAQGEKAWQETGKSEGLLIWRIEKFKVVKSKTPVGSFYENDSYIVLNTFKGKDNEFFYDVKLFSFYFLIEIIFSERFISGWVVQLLKTKLELLPIRQLNWTII